MNEFLKEKIKVILDTFDSNDEKEIDCISVTTDLIGLMKMHTDVPSSTSKTFTKGDFKKRFNLLVDKIYNEDIRLMYHKITGQNKNSDNEFDIGAVTFNSEIILEEIVKLYDSSDPHIIKKRKIMLKIYDHFQLHITQQSHIDSEIAKVDKVINEVSESIGSLVEITKKSIEDDIKSTKLDQISILGVFTGISFVTFGGLSLIGDVTDTLKGDFNPFVFTYSVMLIGFVLINALVILMQYIKSITDDSIRVRDLLRYHDKQNDKKMNGFLLELNFSYILLMLLGYAGYMVINCLIN